MKTKNKKMFAGKIILFEKRLGQMALMRWDFHNPQQNPKLNGVGKKRQIARRLMGKIIFGCQMERGKLPAG
jgi:hypothetical protein